MQTGFIMLGLLFAYDIFFVFFTPIMISVAKQVQGPIKLQFPKNLLHPWNNTPENMSLLGLGDIVIPGAMIQMLAKFDYEVFLKLGKKRSPSYFLVSTISYFAGFAVTIGVMMKTGHGQPALLYLVPAILGSSTFMALIRREFGTFFSFEIEQKEKDKKEK